jgi:hypothetical protein
MLALFGGGMSCRLLRNTLRLIDVMLTMENQLAFGLINGTWEISSWNFLNFFHLLRRKVFMLVFFFSRMPMPTFTHC